MAMDWREIKDKIEEYCKKKYAETGVSPIFRKNNMIYHLKLNEEEVKYLRRAITALLKEGKIVKRGSKTYRWDTASYEQI